jgi:hypothetical protein
MCDCILQMSENRRRGGRRAQQEQAAQQEEVPKQQQLPPPPPMSIEQMFLMQTQAVQAIGQTLAAIQQQQQQQAPPQPQMPRDKRAKFMRGHPPTFAHSSVPMDAEDWLRTVERELHTAQCDDREKVLYGPRLLRGAAQSWWESYLATHDNPDTITWEEFRGNFRQYHVPAGLTTVKKEEFLALKQGSSSVSEYRDRFLQLSRYAPEDVNTDIKRQYRFLRGLVDPLQYQLMNHTFPTFQHLIDRAIMTERKRKEMEDRKRKISGPQPGSSNRPRFSSNQPQQFRQNQCPPQHQASAVPKAVSSAPILESSEQPVRRRPVSEAESAGTSSSCPSKRAEQSGITSSGWKQSMFPLWRARPLGDAMSEEGSPAAVRP